MTSAFLGVGGRARVVRIHHRHSAFPGGTDPLTSRKAAAYARMQGCIQDSYRENLDADSDREPPTTIAYQKRAGHAAVTDRYGWPGL